MEFDYRVLSINLRFIFRNDWGVVDNRNIILINVVRILIVNYDIKIFGIGRFNIN